MPAVAVPTPAGTATHGARRGHARGTPTASTYGPAPPAAAPAPGTYILGDQSLQPALLLELREEREAERWRHRPRQSGAQPTAAAATEGTCPPRCSPRPPSAGHR